MSNPLPWELLSIVEGFHNYSLPALDFFDPRRSFGPLRVWSRSASRPAGLAAELSMISLGAAVHSVTSQSRTAPIVTPVASGPFCWHFPALGCVRLTVCASSSPSLQSL